MTIRHSSANICAMTFRMLLRVSAVWLAVSSASASTGQDQAPLMPAELSEPEFQSLVAKTNMYVKALNAVDAAQRSYDRYDSWLDVKKGPTGKERYISYGLYEISHYAVDEVKQAAKKGPTLQPALPDLDSVIVRLSDSFSALAPLVKKAHDYYEQEDFKDDDAKGGKELHAAMMPLFQATFASAHELRRGLDTLKAQVDRRQLAEIEKTSGRKYEWHLRSFMLAAKGLINLLPDNADSPLISVADYKARYGELEEAYNAFQTFSTENRGRSEARDARQFRRELGERFFHCEQISSANLGSEKIGSTRIFQPRRRSRQELQRSDPADEQHVIARADGSLGNDFSVAHFDPSRSRSRDLLAVGDDDERGATCSDRFGLKLPSRSPRILNRDCRSVHRRSTSAGRWIRARAIAVRCCSPPLS